jgi:hypothetical protein
VINYEYGQAVGAVKLEVDAKTRKTKSRRKAKPIYL